MQELREEPGRCRRVPERCGRNFAGAPGEQEVREKPGR